MKNFRGRLIRVDENDYIVEDSDSDTDSEVGAVFDEDEELQILFAPGLGPGPGIPFGALGLALYTDSEEESPAEDEEEEELLSIHSTPSSNAATGGHSSDSEGDIDLEVNRDVNDLFIPITRRPPLLSANVGGTSSSLEAEDVSLEGYFAFGGERRRVSGTGLGVGGGVRSRSGSTGSRLTSTPRPGIAGSSSSSSVWETGVVPLREAPASTQISLSPAAIQSLSLGEVGLEQILARAIAMNQAEIEARSLASATTGNKPATSSLEQEIMSQASKSGSSSNTNAIVKSNSESAEQRTDDETGDTKRAQKDDRLSGQEGDGRDQETTIQDFSPAKRNKLGDDPASESGESCRTPEIDGDRSVDLADATCNPMVSDMEELDENDDALRGDRIGATTYSERHVLKILMKWVQELPKYSEEGVKNSYEEAEEPLTESAETAESTQIIVDRTRFLEKDFEEEMALLWDMSFEPDVMNFLVQHNAFNIIRETISVSCCDRLTEIGLGIMANIISQQSIVEDFSIIDASIGVVEGVVSLSRDRNHLPRVPILIQVFAVLRRITWFLRNVALLPSWTRLLLSRDFLDCANFILCSSTNALLLGNVIVTLFSILEALSPDLAEKEQEEEDPDEVEEESGSGHDTEANLESEESGGRIRRGSSSSLFFGKALLRKRKDFENYAPFCDMGFIPALCEGLNELLKAPRPRKTMKLTSTREHNHFGDEDATDERNLDDLEPPIPEGHVVTAVLNGLSSFVYLYKTPNGKEAIREHHLPVLNFLLNLLQKFSLITTDSLERSSTLDYFSLGLNLLSFCSRQEDRLSSERLQIPLVTASQLMAEEEEDTELRTLQQKDGISHDSRTFIALILHEYYASLGDTFGLEGITQFKAEVIKPSSENRGSAAKKYKKFLQLVDNLVTAAAAAQGQDEEGTELLAQV